MLPRMNALARSCLTARENSCMFETLRGVGQHRGGRGTDADMGLLAKLRKFIEDECKAG